MDHKILAICSLVALTAGLYGCDESVDNGLNCSDGVYKAQCADSKYMMYCDTEAKVEKVKVCSNGLVCKDINGIADCVNPDGSEPSVTSCNAGDVQCSG